MTTYTFYCCRPDGVALSTETHELPTPAAAAERASTLLGEHRRCSHIVVCEDEREVLVRRREPDPALEAVTAVLDARAAASVDVAVIATAVDGVVTFWNQAAATLYGWTREEALGRNIMELTPSMQSRPEAQAIMRALQAGQTWEGSIVLRKRDGTPFSAFVVDMPVGPVAEGRGVIVGASVPAEKRHLIAGRQGQLAAALQACWTEAGAAAAEA